MSVRKQSIRLARYQASELPAQTPVVAVWCNRWLGLSETFVRNQINALTTYRPWTIGLHTDDSPLVVPDRAPYVGRRGELTAAALLRGAVPPGLLLAALQARPSVIHAHYGPGGLMAMGLARAIRRPLIVTFHGYDATSLPKSDPEYRRRLDLLFRRATLLVAVSDFVASKLEALGAPSHKIRVQYIGIPIDNRPRSEQTRLGILFVGRFTEKKGAADLIEAVARLEPRFANVPVRFVGYGLLEAAMKQLAADRGIRAEFLGPRNSSEIAEYLSRAEIFVAPSKTAPTGDAEGFGMVFLEAALQGVPVVSFRHGGVVESVEDGKTGLLAAEGDIEGLADRISQLLDDPARAAAFGAAGRSRVITQFDIAKTTRGLEALYDEAISTGQQLAAPGSRI